MPLHYHIFENIMELEIMIFAENAKICNRYVTTLQPLLQNITKSVNH